MSAPARPLRWIGLALLLAYAGVVIFGGLTDRLVLWPSTDPMPIGAAQRRAIPFAGGALEAIVARSAEAPALFVLRFYGNADRAERWAAGEATQLGATLPVELWGVNYPGYGNSTGPASLARIAEAALTAYDAIAAEAKGRPIVVMGTSLGTAAALHVAADRAVAGVVLHNPPALRELILGEHGWWNAWLLAWPISRGVPAALDSIANARRARAPAVFAMAERDEVVPHRYHRMIAEAYRGQKQIFVSPVAGHNDELEPPLARAYGQAVAAMLRAAIAR